MTMHFKGPNLPILASTAIELINKPVMVDGAWRIKLGVHPEDGKPLDWEEQQAISVVAAMTYSHDGTGYTMELVKWLAAYLGKSEDAAVRVLRRLEPHFLRQVQSEERGNVWHWRLASPAIYQALEDLTPLLRTIDEVIALQVQDPDNPHAGRHLLEGVYVDLGPDLPSKELYFNIVLNRHNRLNGSK